MSAPPHTRSRQVRRRVGVPVLLLSAAACAAVLAAQGASAGTQRTGNPATQVTSSASNDERAEAFTTCMRSHGVSDFPGITISANGQIQLNGGSVNPISATYQAAAKACASLLPTGSALPTAPEPPAPDAPTLTFTCDGDCPTPPKAPAPPS